MRTSNERANPDALIREPIWVESNEQKEAARAMEMLHAQLTSAVVDPYAWKWVLLTLHHTIQSFVAASLTGLEEDCTGEPYPAGGALRVRYGEPRPHAEPRADHLAGLFERVKTVTGFHSGEEVDRDIGRLIEYRGAIFQCVPASWILRVNGLPRMTQNCLRIVEFLGWNPGHIAWQKESLTDLARVKFLASIKVVEALDGQYNP